MNKGARGEALAAAYLQQKGWRLLYQNWRSGIYEIDLIAQDGHEIVFVEVRAVSAKVPWEPESTITPRKKARLLRAITVFLAQHPEWETQPARIDVVAIRLSRPPELWHVADAFR